MRVMASSGMRAEVSSKSAISRSVAVLASVLALVPLPGTAVFTGSVISFLLLLPVFLVYVRARRALLLLIALSMIVVVVSPLSALVAGATAEAMPQWDWTLRPLSLACSTIVIHWCAQRIGILGAVLFAIPAPMLFDWITRSGQGNDWKYAVSIWVTVGVLVAVHRRGLAWKLPAVAAIVVVSAMNDTRGIIAMVAAGAVVELVARTGGAKLYRFSASIVGTVVVSISAFQLAVAGALGSNIQNTMLMQTERGPLSLLRAARPESGGNIALVASEPFRFVIGDAVTADQAAIIRNSFAQVDRDPNSLYVNRGILQGAELHSIAADLWLHLGFIGLALAVAFGAFFLALGIKALRSRSQLTVVIVFISLRGLWDLLFSPVSDTRCWPLYLALGLYFFAQEKVSYGNSS